MSAIILQVEQTIRVTLSGSREGAYIVTEEHPDGSLVVLPDKTRPHVDAGKAGCDPGSSPSDGAQ